MAKKTIIVHGAGVEEAGTENERLSVHGEVRTQALIKHLQNDLKDALEQDPKDIQVIISGGKVETNKGQKLSEAEHMYNYLQKEAADLAATLGDQVQLEKTSDNSIKNIEDSSKLIDPKTEEIHILSNNFHLKRLKKLYKHHVDQNKIKTIGADSTLKNKPNEKEQKLLDRYNKKRSFFSKAREQLVEKVGLLFAGKKISRTMANIPSNTPLRKVPFKILGGLFSSPKKRK